MANAVGLPTGPVPAQAVLTEPPITGPEPSTVPECMKISLNSLSLRLTLSVKNLDCARKEGIRNCIITKQFLLEAGRLETLPGFAPRASPGPSLALSPSLRSRSPPKRRMFWSVTVPNVPPTPSHHVIYLRSQRYTSPCICASVNLHPENTTHGGDMSSAHSVPACPAQHCSGGTISHWHTEMKTVHRARMFGLHGFRIEWERIVKIWKRTYFMSMHGKASAQLKSSDRKSCLMQKEVRENPSRSYMLIW